MSRRIGITAAMLALGLVLLAFWALPRPDTSRTAARAAVHLPTSATPDQPKPVFIPEIIAADSLFVRDGSCVGRGDTLAIRVSDPFVLVREDLHALRDGLLSPAEALATLEQVARVTSEEDPLPDFLIGLQTDVMREATRPVPGYVDEDVDGAYVRAEIMGAEDAIRDLRSKLEFVTPAATADARQQAAALRQEIAEREQFLEGARRTLATQAQRRRPTWRLAAPKLTAAQRARIDNYARGFRADTNYVLAPATGLFRVSDAGLPGRIEPEATLPRPATSTPEDERPTGSYVLRARGTPRLWSTAKRRDSTEVAVPGGLIVTPD